MVDKFIFENNIDMLVLKEREESYDPEVSMFLSYKKHLTNECNCKKNR
jgi:hypothetical protein